MKRFTIGLTIALITFGIGIALLSITRSRQSQGPEQPAGVTNKIAVQHPRERREWPQLPNQGETAKGTDLSIVVAVPEKPPALEVRHIKLGKNGKATINLDLGETIDGREIALHFADNLASYRVLERYRTTLSISAEGPHLDLVDWRHFDSPWTALESLGTNRFRTLESDQMDHSRFPKTTKAEIVEEARARVGKDWPELIERVESCNGPNDGSCFVGISSLYLRIQKRVNDRWTDVGLVEVTIPMGC